jgi:flagellar biosynthesis/type III secretory pathway chaperone
MSTHPATREQTPLEQVLLDVHATLADLLDAADEQHQAVVVGDRERLESVTRRQERLAARLQRAETQRLSVLEGRMLDEAVSELPATDAARVESLVNGISDSVKRLRERQAANASLLERSMELAGQTVQFLQRLLSGQDENPAYTTRGLLSPRHSLLVDSRA